MSGADSFFDTSVLLYLLSSDTEKADRVEAERYKFSFYDSVIVASALHARCKILYSEDLQHGQVIEKQLRVTNPFEDN